MTKQKKELAVTASNEVLAQLASSYPQEEGGRGITLPRLGMYSQDKTIETGTGRNKKIEVVAAAGEFFIEHETDEVDENGKKLWKKDELGTEIEAIIFYKRHQLRLYDESTGEYTNSPVYDSKDEIVPLFKNKKEVARGTPDELKAMYMYEKQGKRRSALEDNRILYILYKGDAYQMNLRGSSMYSLLSYEKTVQAPTVLTKMSSELCENGGITWNKMTFKDVRKLTGEEAEKVMNLQKEAAQAVVLSKASYAKKDEDIEEVTKDFKDAVNKF